MRFSLWFDSQEMNDLLPRLGAAAAALPPEALRRGAREWSVQAVDWDEPPLLEESAESDQEVTTIEAAIAHLAEFAQDDCACSLEMEWMLWEYGEQGWKHAPHPVIIRSLGPSFDNGDREDGEVVIELGADDPFVAEMAPWDANTRHHLQANILQLLAYCHAVQRRLQPVRRRLWSENEADWTARLTLRLQNTEGVWIQ